MISLNLLQNSPKNIFAISLKYSTSILSKFLIYGFILIHIPLTALDPVGVTYQLNGGRFGDNLLSYMHAKWFSFQYGIPLFYRPFPYSEALCLERFDQRLEGNRDKKFFHHFLLKKGDSLENFFLPFGPKSTLYIIPYFPEFQWELERDHGYPYFKVDWKNPEFLELIKRMIAPKGKIPRFSLPRDKICVALHIRTGDRFDDADTVNFFVLKFPPIDYYIKQLKQLAQIFEDQELYVHIFSDSLDMEKLACQIQSHFDPEKVQFGFRKEKNSWDHHVIEDFFALTQFHASIHGDSNFSFCAGVLSDYLIEIMPKNSSFDEVVIKGKDEYIIEKFIHLFNN